MTGDLVAWLREKIAQRRDLYEIAAKRPRSNKPTLQGMLDEVEAFTAILNEHSTPHTVIDGFCVEEGGECTHTGENQCAICGVSDCRTLRALALAFQHNTGYREEWRRPLGD